MPKDSAKRMERLPPGDGTTPSEEMYLVTIAVAEEDGSGGPLPLAAVAHSLSISPVSANQMVHRLAERGLVDYHPYRGAVLTAAGRSAARRVLRGRRLWATFLVDRLGFGPAEADALACRLEHVTPPEVADRLSGFLGEPAVGPLGRDIPPAQDSPPGSSVRGAAQP